MKQWRTSFCDFWRVISRQKKFSRTWFMVISLSFHLYFTVLRKTVGKKKWKFRRSSTLKCSFDPIFQDYHLETRHKVEICSALNTQTKTCLAATLAAKLYMLGGVWAWPLPGHRLGINRKLFMDTTCIKMYDDMSYALCSTKIPQALWNAVSIRGQQLVKPKFLLLWDQIDSFGHSVPVHYQGIQPPFCWVLPYCKRC